MKNNIFGYVFLVFIIAIMAFAIYKVGSEKKKNADASANNTSSVMTKEKGTELTLGISNMDTINPIITNNKNVQNVTKLIYEPLINVTEDGKAEPCLASEWATTDNKTYIVKIKSGIKWQDGTMFSSNDVKYTIDRLKETGKSSVYADCVEHVEEVDIIDNTTIRIILSEKIPFFQYYLNFPILSSSFYGDEDFWKTKKNKAPMTTGRFKISEVTDKSIVLTKNDMWWNKEGQESIIEKINLNKYSSVAELYNAFKLGRIDLISTENTDYQKYIGTIGYNTTDIEGRKMVFLALNTQSNLLSDINVRKAIRSAINKQEIVSKIYGKMYSVANFPLSTNSYLVKRGDEGYYKLDDIENNLKESGWALRAGIWQKTVDYKRIRLELNLVVKSKDEKRVKTANYIKDKFAENGIIVNVIEVSNKEYKNYLKNKNYDMILCEFTQSITPSLATFLGDGNLSNFYNQEVKEIMNYIGNITDEKELQSKYQRLYEIYNEEVPYIGIAKNKIKIITNSYLTGNINSRWYNLFFGFKEWYTS